MKIRELLVLYQREENLMRIYAMKDILKSLNYDIIQNLRYVIANMLKTLITQQCFIVKHFIISLNSWALYQT